MYGYAGGNWGIRFLYEKDLSQFTKRAVGAQNTGISLSLVDICSKNNGIYKLLVTLLVPVIIKRRKVIRKGNSVRQYFILIEFRVS